MPPTIPPAVVVVGVLDGVHLGHQALLERALRVAARQGWRPRLLTFDPHPLAVLGGRSPPPPIEPVAQRRARLAARGFEVVVRPFDTTLAASEAEPFARELLVGELDAAAVVVGAEFRFGRDRRGDVHTLAATPSRAGGPLAVHAVPAVRDALGPISSTRVRQAIGRGAVEEAAGLLGRLWAWHGQVVPGAQRGGRLGFGTANLLPDACAWPADGVYAVWARVDEACLPAVANVGRAPTFGGDQLRRLEVHLLTEGVGALRGAHLCVAFARRLRPEQKFASPQALAAQIRADIAQAAQALGQPPPASTWACSGRPP